MFPQSTPILLYTEGLVKTEVMSPVVKSLSKTLPRIFQHICLTLSTDILCNASGKDFIIVSAEGYIISIESKRTLGKGDSVQKSLHQLNGTMQDLESYFRSGILTIGGNMISDWIFVPMIYCEEVEDDISPCGSCENYIIRGNIYTFSQK